MPNRNSPCLSPVLLNLRDLLIFRCKYMFFDRMFHDEGQIENRTYKTTKRFLVTIAILKLLGIKPRKVTPTLPVVASATSSLFLNLYPQNVTVVHYVVSVLYLGLSAKYDFCEWCNASSVWRSVYFLLRGLVARAESAMPKETVYACGNGRYMYLLISSLRPRSFCGWVI